MPSDNQPALLNHCLDPRLDRVFTPLCVALAPAQIELLKREVADHVQAIRQALHQNEFVDVTLAEQIAAVSHQLLNDYARCSEAQRSLIVGAVRYFAKNQDADTDFSSLLGFDDDVQVLNFVLVALGRNDLRIELK